MEKIRTIRSSCLAVLQASQWNSLVAARMARFANKVMASSQSVSTPSTACVLFPKISSQSKPVIGGFLEEA